MLQNVASSICLQFAAFPKSLFNMFSSEEAIKICIFLCITSMHTTAAADLNLVVGIEII